MAKRRAIIVEYGFDDPWMNLAYETCLMDVTARDARNGVETFVLATWQNDNTIVIGRNQNALAEFDLEKTKEDRVMIARRPTGGGAVYHDMGNLNFTFVSPRKYYDSAQTARIIMDAVGSFGVEVAFSGRNDITAGGRKFSGNAYTLNEQAGLHHGTLLISADLSKIAAYLTPDKLKYAGKSVASTPSPVVALSSLDPDITVEMLRERVEASFRETMTRLHPGITFELLGEGEIPGDELQRVYALYKSEEWVLGSRKEAPYCAGKFRWGKVALHFHLREGIIRGMDVVTDAMLLDIWGKIEDVLKGCAAVPKEICQRLDALGQDTSDEGEREVLTDLCGLLKQDVQTHADIS